MADLFEDGVVALVKSILGDAIAGVPYDTILPEGATLPAITYQFVGGRSAATLQTSGMQSLRTQFDIFTTTGREGRQIRAQLVQGLNGYSGLLIDGTFLDSARYIQPIDGFENTARQFRRAAEFYLDFTFN